MAFESNPRRQASPSMAPISPLTSNQMRALIAIVLANYAAQIPYNLHLYGLTFNVRGVGLLAATLAWFLIGVWGLVRGSRVGYALLVSFLGAEFLFYFRNEILLISFGYGLPYHLTHGADPLLWVVFLIGDINFVAAGYFLWSLLPRGPR